MARARMALVRLVNTGFSKSLNVALDIRIPRSVMPRKSRLLSAKAGRGGQVVDYSGLAIGTGERRPVPAGAASEGPLAVLHEAHDQRREDQLHRQLHLAARHDDDVG